MCYNFGAEKNGKKRKTKNRKENFKNLIGNVIN